MHKQSLKPKRKQVYASPWLSLLDTVRGNHREIGLTVTEETPEELDDNCLTPPCSGKR